MVLGELSDCLDEQVVSAFVAGALDAAETAPIEAHLARCAACRGVVGAAAHGDSVGTLQAGSVLANKYRVEELLGRGGMGEVFAAVHVELGHRVAIKV